MTRTGKNHEPESSWNVAKLSEGQLEPLFRLLNLAHTRRIYQDVADRAEKENWTYRNFLALLLAEEVAHRKQTRLQRFTHKAHFPFLKTIDEFDFSLQLRCGSPSSVPTWDRTLLPRGGRLILYGKTGRGKTHLAIAIGYRAIQNGFETFFTTAAELSMRATPSIFRSLLTAGRGGAIPHGQSLCKAPSVRSNAHSGSLLFSW
jgi:DNA replication protein DnaC